MITYGFRWMNCLLIREFPVHLLPRLWDTYLSQPQGFDSFHIYVCLALLMYFSNHLMTLDYPDILMFLQKLPTQNWTVDNIEIILSQAFIYFSLWGG